MSTRLRIGLWVASAAVGIASLALLAAPAGAAPAGAPGNNGTVKIHEGAGEPSPVTRNETHVCTFHVHALHFDAEQALTFTVQSWEPTGDRSMVLSGSITADATGEGRSPVEGAYSLPDGHYRLTVDTGNGTPTQDKHKMFWVRCASETPSPTPSESPGTPTPTPTETQSPSSTPTVTPSQTGPTTPTTSAPSSPGTPTATSPTTATSSPGGFPPPGTPPAAGGLAVTGSPIVTIAGLGLALILAGVALLTTPAARRRMFGH